MEQSGSNFPNHGNGNASDSFAQHQPSAATPNMASKTNAIDELTIALEEFDAESDELGEQRDALVFVGHGPRDPAGVPPIIERAEAYGLLEDLNLVDGEDLEYYVDLISDGFVPPRELAVLMEVSVQAFEEDWKIIFERAIALRDAALGPETGGTGLYYALRECLQGDGLAAYTEELDLYGPPIVETTEEDNDVETTEEDSNVETTEEDSNLETAEKDSDDWPSWEDDEDDEAWEEEEEEEEEDDDDYDD